MTTKAGVGMSHHHSPSIAGYEAAEKALENAGVRKPDFVFMFATVGYEQRSLLQAVREATGGAPLCGCSGEGTIDGTMRMNRTSLWSLWPFLQTNCGGATG